MLLYFVKFLNCLWREDKFYISYFVMEGGKVWFLFCYNFGFCLFKINLLGGSFDKFF